MATIQKILKTPLFYENILPNEVIQLWELTMTFFAAKIGEKPLLNQKEAYSKILKSESHILYKVGSIGSIYLIAHTYKCYSFKFYTTKNAIPDWVLNFFEQQIQPYAYTREELLRGARDYQDVWAIHKVATLIDSDVEEPNQLFVNIFIEGLQSKIVDIQIQTAWVIASEQAYWKVLKPVLNREIVKLENGEKVIEELKTVLEYIEDDETYNKTLLIGDKLEDLKQFMKKELEGTLSIEEEKSLINAFSFLNVPNNIYVWYSERTINATKEEVEKYLQAFEQWQSSIESYYHYLSPVDCGSYSQDCYHTLGAYIIMSQFLWHYYQLPVAEKHLLRALELATTLKDENGCPMVPVRQMVDIYSGAPKTGVAYYHNANLFYLNHFYLGELYEQQGNTAKAQWHFQQFLGYEPDFESEPLILHPDYYDIRRQIPDSIQAQLKLK